MSPEEFPLSSGHCLSWSSGRSKFIWFLVIFSFYPMLLVFLFFFSLVFLLIFGLSWWPNLLNVITVGSAQKLHQCLEVLQKKRKITHNKYFYKTYISYLRVKLHYGNWGRATCILDFHYMLVGSVSETNCVWMLI